MTDGVREALEELVRIDDEGGGLYTNGESASELVLALDAARKALADKCTR
jgi:hypothetical protein